MPFLLQPQTTVKQPGTRITFMKTNSKTRFSAILLRLNSILLNC